MRSVIVIVTVGLAMVLAFDVMAQLDDEAAANRQDSEHTVDGFDLLVERNIFLRDRRPRRDSSTDDVTSDDAPSARSSVPVDPASHFVLRGVTLQGAERTAFVEDQRSGETRRVTTGDALAGGEVVEIDMDYITFRVAVDQRRIGLGKRLTGKAVPKADIAASIPDKQGAKEGDEAPSAIESSGDEQDSVVERMRRRRQRQLRGQSDETQ